MGQTALKVRLLEHTPEPEKLVATAARLCYSPANIDQLAESVAVSDQQGFIKKLMDMGHHTPLEHISFTFGIEGVSRSLLAQITRHRIASFSVQSQRYVGETRQQNNQGIFDYVIPPAIVDLGPAAVAEYERQMAQMQEWYDGWVEKLGGGRGSYEDARFVLPNAAETKLVVTMNARELRHFFSLRCCQRAQWEIRRLAEEMLSLVKQVAPVIFADAGPGCLVGPCPEGKLSCGQMVTVRKRYGVN
ncbi:Thymidylate synthase thyX [Desulfotomaculum nigrificans CO-1-SRB]|uniref:Flavin-dependent thymidylate synthase n=1 Tax=Desulfotomaculum nigrificans (strain DSM 14880 / VKM B-2319 / CO-1-SRB) TaxID=868595 RepID=F6B574_DESCC|nr:FAD-dependent thymidylate synthase [Desulfotomaculum nigrificans]AEF93093.1 Thymidylate synthase thyX [Desulfotomaculum nigrificans CO-1-SRB]